MKIHYITNSAVPSRAANSVHVIRMCQAFRKNGHEPILFCKPGDVPGEEEGRFYGITQPFRIVKLQRPRIRGLGPLLYAARTAGASRREGTPDLLYGRSLYGLAALKDRGVPFIYESHAPPANPVQRLAETRLFRSPSFKRLVVISSALKAIYQSLYPRLPETRITVAHDGADLPAAPAQSPRAQSGRLQVGYVGHLYPGRGIDLILDLARISPDMDFHLVGGTEKDILHWKARAAKPNVFFHGFILPADLQPYFDRFDVLLAPYQNRVATAGSVGDTSKWMSPLKLFEYMAQAKAMICSDIPVLREVIRDGHNGLLAEPSDLQGWKDRLIRLQDPNLRDTLGANGRLLIEREYSWETRARRVLETPH